jgi:hypothetical protein
VLPELRPVVPPDPSVAPPVGSLDVAGLVSVDASLVTLFVAAVESPGVVDEALGSDPIGWKHPARPSARRPECRRGRAMNGV